MKNNRNVGIAVAVLGLLMTCCLCPLALNSLVVLGGGAGFYGRIFASRVGRLAATSYVIGAQNICAAVLALVVLIIGVVVLVQARSDGSQPEQKAISSD